MNFYAAVFIHVALHFPTDSVFQEFSPENLWISETQLLVSPSTSHTTQPTLILILQAMLGNLIIFYCVNNCIVNEYSAANPARQVLLIVLGQ